MTPKSPVNNDEVVVLYTVHSSGWSELSPYYACAKSISDNFKLIPVPQPAFYVLGYSANSTRRNVTGEKFTNVIVIVCRNCTSLNLFWRLQRPINFITYRVDIFGFSKILCLLPHMWSISDNVDSVLNITFPSDTRMSSPGHTKAGLTLILVLSPLVLSLNLRIDR